MIRSVAAACVIFAAAVILTISMAGVLRSRNNLAAVHCLGVANVTLGPLALAAVLIAVGFGVGAAKMLVLAVVLLFGGPVTSHAIAVAEHRRNPRA